MTRRTHFARRLLESSSLPITMVAQAAGFGSVRRFNEVIRHSFALTPTELRGTRTCAESRFEVRVRVVLPYDFARMLDFFALRAVAGMERVQDCTYERFVHVDGHAGWVQVRFADDELAVELETALAPVALHVVSRVRGMFDSDADARDIDAHLARDPALKSLVEARPGLRVPGVFSPFEAAIRAVVGQQVSVKGATTVLTRIVHAHGHCVSVSRAFPAPHVLRRARCETLGLTRAKAETIRRVSAAFVDGTRLEDVKGVGPWTLAYVALRGTRDADAFPAGDLIIQRGLSVASAKTAEARAEAWRPFRAYGAVHVWTQYAEKRK